jgi:hypothetical protein
MKFERAEPDAGLVWELVARCVIESLDPIE